MRWFGKNYGSAVYGACPQVDAPAGAICLCCEEAIAAGDDGFDDAAGQPMHRACFLRLTIGSLAHQLKVCTCFVPDSTVPHEPAGLTRRQASEEAVRYFEGRHELRGKDLVELLLERMKS